MTGPDAKENASEIVDGVRIVRSPEEIPSLHGCTFVPTMGGLHAGHVSLVDRARRDAERLATGGERPLVVVSVFVNPTQFNERSDYERYPRDVAFDASLVAPAGADVVFAPEVETIYPPDVEVPMPPIPPMARDRGLEDKFRPGHLEGVCQVCARFFRLLKPRVAVFGQKDWQQLQMIRWLVRELGMDIEIPGEPTIREPDCVAMASRNRFLPPEDRERASAIPQAWQAAQRERDPQRAEAAMRRVIEGAGIEVEYAVVRDAHMLTPLPDGEYAGEPGSARAIIGARLGAVRLLDNAPWPA